MQHLTKEQLEELRAALDAETTDLEEQLAEHGKKVGNNWQGTPAGFENETDSEPEDIADRFEELATNVPLVEELESRLKDVKDALEKMDKGKYGICEKTGKEIPFERLEANPAARTIVEHTK
jgi:RNA polymerase-binding transcription factor DksA